MIGMRGMIGKPRSVLGVVLALFLLVASGVPVAQAHAALEESNPKVGQKVSTSPAAVTLTFSDDMVALGAIVQVLGPNGDAEVGKTAISGRTVTQKLAAGLPDGSYIVTWRLTSRDGHVLSGTYTYLQQTPGAPRATAGVSTASPLETTTTAAGPSPTTQPAPSTPPSVVPANDDSHRDSDSPPVGWVIVGVVVLGATIAAVVITEVRRRRRRGPGPRGPSSG